MTPFTRREFVRTLLAGSASLCLEAPVVHAAVKNAFSFVLLGDLHFDKLAHHDLEWLKKEKPDDFRQVQDYSRITTELQPLLFDTLRRTVSASSGFADAPVAFVAQVGDFVEGLCGSEALATRQNSEALEFVRASKLGAPFLFTKGNHDITGPGATEAFKSVFHPFLAEQAAAVEPACKLIKACYALDVGEALFCFFDAYDKESLPWLEATLAKRSARHCFVVLHPPVVPYGARATWHLHSSEREKSQRERLLELLGKHNAFVLTGHSHKYSLLVRATPGGGKFLQLALSSVISSPDPIPKDMLSGVKSYNGDQVKVEPNFSPATESQRRAVYDSEATFVDYFEYADLPGFATLTVNGPQVTANIYSGVNQKLWRTIDLAKLITG